MVACRYIHSSCDRAWGIMVRERNHALRSLSLLLAFLIGCSSEPSMAQPASQPQRHLLFIVGNFNSAHQT